jgi:hypothetical protein
MKFISLQRSFLLAGLLLCRWEATSQESLPDPSSVLERMIQRAEEESRAGETRKYTYEKRSVIEELDSVGKATKTTEEVYEVVPIQGIPFSRLVKIQNRELTAEETKEQNRKEQEFRHKVAAKDSDQRRNDDTLNPYLVDRYDFKVERRDSLENRPVLVLSFRPKTNRRPERTVEDKVLNRLAGTVWVDEREAEVAQLQVRLTEDLWLGWFGMIGSIKQCDLKIQRQRLPDGVWVNKEQTVMLCGRKILSPMRRRTQEESYSFKKP